MNTKINESSYIKEILKKKRTNTPISDDNKNIAFDIQIFSLINLLFINAFIFINIGELIALNPTIIPIFITAVVYYIYVQILIKNGNVHFFRSRIYNYLLFMTFKCVALGSSVFISIYKNLNVTN